MSQALTVFVNTSDGFEDCWEPFFTLWSRYTMPLCHLPVLLNTEHKTYAFGDLDLRATRVSVGSSDRHSWSECLLRGLAQISTPYVLYLQEDYFLKRHILVDVIAQALKHLDNGEADVCYLNQFGPQWPHASGQEIFVPIPRHARYFLSTQAAIWRVDALRDLVREWENGWSFEKFGALRMRRQELLALQWAGADAIDYTYTGVIKGQWLPECVDLFDRERIEVDFTRRGFYKESGRLKTRLEVVRKLLSNPTSFSRSCCSVWRR